MASLHTISPQTFLSLPKPKPTLISPPKSITSSPNFNSHVPKPPQTSISMRIKRRDNWVVAVRSVSEELDVLPVQSSDSTDQQEGDLVGQVGGFGMSEAQLSFEGFSAASCSGESENEKMEKVIDRTINATLVLAAGSFAITKLLTIDQDYWHGWTIYEIVKYAPLHNWAAYEEALKRNPVLAKMVISGVVYSLGDWIAQCCEGKPLFDFDRTRMFRSGLVGFTLHGSLSHYYYQFCEELFPFQDWWVVPVKVVFDQTVWAAIWNSIYYIVLGCLRFESPITIFKELKATFLPLLTAGWKLWPFAHLVTYGLVPVEQRLLWVDCVELIWVTILSTYSNEKSEARIAEMPTDDPCSLPSLNPSEE